MKDFESKKSPFDEGRSRDGEGSSQSSREDSTRTTNDAYKAFTKDKRTRISASPEKREYKPREYGSGDRREGDSERRRSFNPNFTPNNRLVGEAGEKTGREYSSNREGRPFGEKREYGNRSFGSERREYGNRESRPYGEKREYGNSDRRPAYGDRKEFGNRDSKPAFGGERREYSAERSNRPYGEKREYNRDGQSSFGGERGERREYNNRDSKPYDRQGEGRAPREYKPYDRNNGERSSYSNRGNYGSKSEGGSYGEKRGFGDRRDNSNQENKPFGGERREYGNRNSRPYENRGGYGDKRGFSNRREGGFGGDSRAPRFEEKRYNSENYPTFPVEKTDDKIRLNRYISMSGICSRREADEFIQSGIVSVNGAVITELGYKVSPDDVVKFNENIIQNEKKVYILMNKPKGYVTSVEDPHADKTVMDLIKNGCRERVYPVGRLDKNSLGVLLITNDGDMAKKLTHPSYMKKKIYQVSLDKSLTRSDMDQIVNGITLEDGDIHADAISYVGESKSEIGIEIHSGRNRIVRRIFEHLGYRVQKLDRVYFAGLTKQKLRRGEWRFLSPKEVEMLRSGLHE